MFSDESGFPLFAKFSRAFVRRGPGEAFLPQCIKPTVKHGGGKVMVWGCFSILGPGVIKRVEGKMTKEVYHGILTHHYVPHIRKLTKDHPQPQGHWMLQQDNDPKHKAKINKAYLKKQSELKSPPFQLLDWPSQSPDMNPIEHVWAKLKADIRAKHLKFTSEETLWAYVQTEFQRLPLDFIKNLIHSMPRRVKMVIKQKGGSTSY